MVHAAKALAVNMSSTEKANDWRGKNNLVSKCKVQIVTQWARKFKKVQAKKLVK